MSEREIARALAAREGGECEVKTPVGFIDVLTPKKLYEVKAVRGWKGALGQVLAYGRSFPDRKLCLYLYGEATTAQKRLIKGHCTALGVAVEWHREPAPDAPPSAPREVKPVADEMKLVLSALDHSYNIRAGFNVHLVTPTAPIAPEQLDAHMDEALALFDALLDNDLTLTLSYTFAGEQQKVTRTRATVAGEHVFYRLNISIRTERGAIMRASLPGARALLPSGHRLSKHYDYHNARNIPEINRLFDFILHPEFCWASRWSGRARSIWSARWLYVKR